jgi:hypothetical protein
MRISNGLRNLMNALRDDERMLRHESQFVDRSRRFVLTQLAAERQEFAETLRLADGGAPPAEAAATGSFAEQLLELAHSLRVAATGPNSGDAVHACRLSRDRTDAVYERAVALPWPEATLAVLRGQHRRIRHASQELMAIQF